MPWPKCRGCISTRIRKADVSAPVLVIQAPAADWNFQLNSFLLSYCNAYGLDPEAHFCEANTPAEYEPLMFLLYRKQS